MVHKRELIIDQHIADSFLSGEDAGITYFFRLYYKRLCLYAFSLIRDSAAAEDIVQECFAKLCGRKTNLDSRSAIHPYLYAMVRNACAAHRKYTGTRKVKENQSMMFMDKYEHHPQNRLILTETICEIHTILKLLPPQCQRIFRMLFLHGKNYSQIAAELKLSESTIRNQKARAIALIKQKLHLLLLIGAALTGILFS